MDDESLANRTHRGFTAAIATRIREPMVTAASASSPSGAVSSASVNPITACVARAKMIGQARLSSVPTPIFVFAVAAWSKSAAQYDLRSVRCQVFLIDCRYRCDPTIAET
jgi:hypothetical protein